MLVGSLLGALLVRMPAHVHATRAACRCTFWVARWQTRRDQARRRFQSSRLGAPMAQLTHMATNWPLAARSSQLCGLRAWTLSHLAENRVHLMKKFCRARLGIGVSTVTRHQQRSALTATIALLQIPVRLGPSVLTTAPERVLMPFVLCMCFLRAQSGYGPCVLLWAMQRAWYLQARAIWRTHLLVRIEL
jgi:hypothetical protein